jgi:hypothetical protein
MGCPMNPLTPAARVKNIFTRISKDYLYLLILILGLATAVLIQFALRGQLSRDLEDDLILWYMRIQHSGFVSLKAGFANYPPLYL